jgi:hypothetical protein
VVRSLKCIAEYVEFGLALSVLCCVFGYARTLYWLDRVGYLSHTAAVCIGVLGWPIGIPLYIAALILSAVVWFVAFTVAAVSVIACGAIVAVGLTVPWCICYDIVSASLQLYAFRLRSRMDALGGFPAEGLFSRGKYCVSAALAMLEAAVIQGLSGLLCSLILTGPLVHYATTTPSHYWKVAASAYGVWMGVVASQLASLAARRARVYATTAAADAAGVPTKVLAATQQLGGLLTGATLCFSAMRNCPDWHSGAKYAIATQGVLVEMATLVSQVSAAIALPATEKIRAAADRSNMSSWALIAALLGLYFVLYLSELREEQWIRGLLASEGRGHGDIVGFILSKGVAPPDLAAGSGGTLAEQSDKLPFEDFVYGNGTLCSKVVDPCTRRRHLHIVHLSSTEMTSSHL